MDMLLSEQLTPGDVSIVLRQIGIESDGSDGWQTIHSPLRDEKNPSFGINTTTGAWKDHSTGETGDLVNLVETINRLDTAGAIQWIKEQTDLTGALYNPPKLQNDKKQNSFWTGENLEKIKAGINRIKNEPVHDLLTTATVYDCLKPDTLLTYGCGIVDYYYAPESKECEWLALPYSTGCQLYRRDNGKKVMYSVKGSKPGNALFGAKLTTGKDILFIAKSPRETMLLFQEFGDMADVVGIATGEQSKISKELRSALRSQISQANYSEVYIFFDCDTENAKMVSLGFASEVLREASGENRQINVKVVNVFRSTSGAYKDITDCFRDGMDNELIQPLLEEAEIIENIPAADSAKPEAVERFVTVDDFYSYAPENKYIFTPTRELWPASSVIQRTASPKENVKVTTWLAQNRSVEQMSWIPGQPMLIKDKLVSNGGWFDAPGLTTFNLYQAPTIKLGNPDKATPWIEHIKRVYPDHAEHLFQWFAHRLQHPGEKVNHAIIMGGPQGIGKDTILAPIQQGVGPWNFEDVTPAQLMGRFNGFVKSVILRVSEARDMGDVDRYGLYEHLKIYTAAPPEVLRCDEKNRREFSVLNVCGLVITTNHKAGGVYLPADDRRHYVTWSECTKDDFSEGYWKNLWKWYSDQGFQHVAALLHEYDLSGFDPKAPPLKTDAFWEIVDAGRAPEDAELADALDKLGGPDAVTIDQVAEAAGGDFYDWLHDRRNRRKIPHRFETAGYVPVRNDTAKSGLWYVNGKRTVIYVRKDLPKRDRLKEASALSSGILTT